MRAFIITCALAALFGSYGADANLGEFGSPAAVDDRLSPLNETLAMIDDAVDADQESDLAPQPRRRMRSVSSVAAEGEVLLPGVGSDIAVHTRIRTCQGVSVTITSFGGGDWDQDVDSFCDEAVIQGETTEQVEAP